ncbi:MAG: helix-turn-helix transcriptional regulator [Pseudomonadota bacterium]|nr:helix-turn-helix transcriptional regulator [Pseudomonadota bacterium]
MMLSSALALAGAARKKSIRSLAAELGYKQATVLSHMAKGRVPIPLERAVEIAEVVGIDPSEFVYAVIAQKSPSASKWAKVGAGHEGRMDDQPTSKHGFAIENLLGFDTGELNAEQVRIIREVSLDPKPARRWLSPAELPIMLALRDAKPGLATDGLPAETIQELRQKTSRP